MIIDDYGEKTPTVMYGPTWDGEYHMYYRVCPKCGRFVKPDNKCAIPEYQNRKPNATCKKCGRVQMPFVDWIDEDDLDEVIG